ncbi:hypothetical protein CPB84DRAFT_140710 [Gymnopilus junonius]|uniref:Uncharacterized protein n=1 Tax=Gymnopilus junonius TaxID=109634 RepID=A0A9P5TF45_GYMJU|nr:hypothetical protein CPB84DRAFT_140710 [Gymnopilus junonius]
MAMPPPALPAAPSLSTPVAAAASTHTLIPTPTSMPISMSTMLTSTLLSSSSPLTTKPHPPLSPHRHQRHSPRCPKHHHHQRLRVAHRPSILSQIFLCCRLPFLHTTLRHQQVQQSTNPSLLLVRLRFRFPCLDLEPFCVSSSSRRSLNLKGNSRPNPSPSHSWNRPRNRGHQFDAPMPYRADLRAPQPQPQLRLSSSSTTAGITA